MWYNSCIYRIGIFYVSEHDNAPSPVTFKGGKNADQSFSQK